MDESIQAPVLLRLNALLRAGYRIEPSVEAIDAVWLRHPSRGRVAENTLVLYSDGLVVSDCAADPQKTQVRLQPQAQTEFARFLSAVPTPTLWERTAQARVNAFVAVLFIGVLGTIWAVINWAF